MVLTDLVAGDKGKEIAENRQKSKWIDEKKKMPSRSQTKMPPTVALKSFDI